MRWKNKFRKPQNWGYRTKTKKKQKRKVSSFFKKKTFGISRWLLMLGAVLTIFFFPKLKDKFKKPI